ncbi:unnamed protein product [Phytomonas sp. EM1]|nr:unnamed protein product [Phytomonas sp. EM1]|eukprot:CCW64051.1 unnamed protein product [Phytomonas sp. isolate EM1]
MHNVLSDAKSASKPALDLTSRSFHAKKFLKEVVGGVSHSGFEDKIVGEIGNAVEETDEALKHLIRDNLEVFINSKDAMTAVYSRDRRLFTGEALNDISAAFKLALDSCSNLVKPTIDSFLSVRHSRKMQEILEKLFSVLSIPGVLYECCGVRVARRKTHSDPWELNDLDAENHDKKNALHSEVQERKLEINNATSVASSNSSDTRVDGSPNTRGALEEFVNQAYNTAVDEYEVHSDQEIFYWYGTPLLRFKDTNMQRRHVETVSNYSGAMLSLRRAMLYIEENYNLEDGTPLAADIASGPEFLSNGHTSVANGGSEIDNTGCKRSNGAGRTSFTYHFGVSLLRAMLYLEDQLAEELKYANAMDVVLIEDTLSMMMEVAIESVKLHHFCFVTRNTLLGGNAHVLVGLHEKVAEGTAAAVAADSYTPKEGRSRVSLTRVASHYSDSDTEHGETASNHPAFSEGTTYRGVGNMKREMMHPAQYLISIVCDQNTRLSYASAAALLSEATEWLNKLYSTPAMPGVQQQDFRNSAEYGDATRGSVPRSGGKTPARLADSFLDNPNLYSDDHLAFSEASTDSDPEDEINIASATPWGGTDWIRHSDAEAILRAFHTPEVNFETYTTFTFGGMNMGNVLESSCVQMILHSNAILQQLGDCANSEADTMAQVSLLKSFATRMSEACISNVEQAIVSFWTGIASSIRAGIFDFHPDASMPLHRMLQDLLISKRTLGIPADGPSSIDLSARVSTVSSFSGAVNTESKPALNTSLPFAVDALEPHSDQYSPRMFDALPQIRYVPVLPEFLHVRDGVEGGGSGGVVARNSKESVSTPYSGVTLRDLSSQAVLHMVRTARDTLYSLLLSFVNCSVVNAFVRTMSRYTLGDLAAHAHDERIELHAAVLVEVILGQWERMMAVVDQSVWRIKLVIGGSSSTNAVYAEQQVNDVSELLAAIEKLRSDCFNSYLHGIGVLSKAYVSLLPMLSPSGINTASLEYRVRARLSREFVSSFYPNKFLNLLSVVMDRTIPFIQRHIKVNDDAGLLKAKAVDPETLQGEVEDGEPISRSGPRQRRRVLRQDRDGLPNGDSGVALSGPEGTNSSNSAAVLANKATLRAADAHVKLVLVHIDAHEEMMQALVANLLLSFVDMLHNRCRAISVNLHVELEEREGNIMECVADALCTATTVSSIVLDHMLTPCLFSLMANLHSTNPTEVTPITKQRQDVFRQKYLSRVGEHCQLAVDAMLRMYIAIPQQHITHEIRSRGFMSPLFDWQRISSQMGMAVRPYIAKCIVYVARAHETLDCIHQPTLGAAVMQRLVAHLSMAFVTAVSADVNAFEMSLECSPAFLDHAVLLIEAEALTILELVHAMANNVKSANTARGVVLPELLQARNCLQGLVRSLEDLCAARAAALKTGSLAVSAPTQHGKGEAPLNERERHARRDEMVATAMAHLKYMVDAINSHLMETSALGGAPTQSVSNEATQSIADRLARRREGYEVRRIAEAMPGLHQMSAKRKKVSRKDGGATAPLAPKEESRSHSVPPLAQENETDKIAAVALYQIAVEQNERKPVKTMHRDKKPTRVTVVKAENPQQTPLVVDPQLKGSNDVNTAVPEASPTAHRHYERRMHNFKRSNAL